MMSIPTPRPYFLMTSQQRMDRTRKRYAQKLKRIRLNHSSEVPVEQMTRNDIIKLLKNDIENSQALKTLGAMKLSELKHLLSPPDLNSIILNAVLRRPGTSKKVPE